MERDIILRELETVIGFNLSSFQNIQPKETTFFEFYQNFVVSDGVRL